MHSIGLGKIRHFYASVASSTLTLLLLSSDWLSCLSLLKVRKSETNTNMERGRSTVKYRALLCRRLQDMHNAVSVTLGGRMLSSCQMCPPPPMQAECQSHMQRHRTSSAPLSAHQKQFRQRGRLISCTEYLAVIFGTAGRSIRQDTLQYTIHFQCSMHHQPSYVPKCKSKQGGGCSVFQVSIYFNQNCQN